MSTEKEMTHHLLVINDVKQHTQELLEYVKGLVPDDQEKLTGTLSDESFRKRMNVLMVALVVAAKAFDQPKEFIVTNIETIYDGLSAKCKGHGVVEVSTVKKETLN